MFQQTSAWERAGSARQSARSMWLIGRHAPAQVRRGQVGLVDPPGVEPVEVQEPGAGLAEVAGRRRQERAGAHRRCRRSAGAAAPGRATAATAPGRRAWAASLDQPGGHAGRRLAPGRGAVVQQRLELVPADGVRAMKSRSIRPSRREHVEQGEGEGRVAAGERLEVQVGGLRRLGADRVDDDLGAGRSGEPVLEGVRRRGRPGWRPRPRCRRRHGPCAGRTLRTRSRRRTAGRRARPGCRCCRGRPRWRPSGGRSASGRKRRAARACRCSGR